MTAPLAFQKYEGLGNDFLLIDAADARALTGEAASALCDRHFGIGADGVLLLLPPRVTSCDIRMRVINADGSVPEMCGNGVRCVALRVARARGLREGVVRIETDAGERVCAVEDHRGEGLVTVDMGVVRLGGDRQVVLDGEPIAVALADAGNPHAVLFGDFTRIDVERLGPRIASHRDFPTGTNVEFARARSSGFDLIVWERGVGITLACGTGACATVAVACSKGLAAQGVPIGVHLPGGRLDVTLAKGGRATMRGPARHVFSGVVQN
ncbi:MAG TPA: diaminopimelate epimerase [Polyangiaceae bacterium]|jgi:diaminopimelate epimerase|nr:diaminopimelate epimerase [Polyangiaceae bacterium]